MEFFSYKPYPLAIYSTRIDHKISLVPETLFVNFVRPSPDGNFSERVRILIIRSERNKSQIPVYHLFALPPQNITIHLHRARCRAHLSVLSCVKVFCLSWLFCFLNIDLISLPIVSKFYAETPSILNGYVTLERTPHALMAIVFHSNVRISDVCTSFNKREEQLWI